MAKQVVNEELVVIMDMICNMIYLLVLGNHSTWSKLVFLMLISWKSIWYLCNMNFLWYNKRRCFFLLWCFLQSGLVLMLHKKVLLTTLCDIMSVELFFRGQKRWRLGKKFGDTNFRFFTPFAANDFQWIQAKRLITSEGRCWTNKQEHLEICCF